MIKHDYGFLVRAWFAHVHVVDVVQARLIELCRLSSSCGSPKYHIGRFMFIDQLCRMIGILGTIIRSFVGCIALCVRIWR